MYINLDLNELMKVSTTVIILTKISICSSPMPFPLNRLFLDALADTDFLATLSLMDVSSTLNKFISQDVLTLSNLCRFLQENQYVLHHGTSHRSLISDSEVRLLHRAFETLQTRHGNSLYHQCLQFLGPLISRTPFKQFQKSPGLLSNFSLSYFTG